MRRLVSLLLLGGCSIDLPQITEVSDLRVLAVAAEPPEIAYDAPADVPVRFSALVVDPRGGSLDYRFELCPVESSVACEDYDSQRAAAPEEHAPALDAARALTLAGTAEATGGVFALPSFDVVIPVGLAAYHDDVSLFGFGTGAWPSAVFSATRGGVSVIAQKRVTLSLRHLVSEAPRFADELGVVLCQDGATTDCLQVPPRTANTNPVFQEMLVQRDGGDFVPLETSLEAEEEIFLRPVFTPESFEAHWLLRTDIETRELMVQETVEDLSVQWFATGGELGYAVTWPWNTVSLDNRFTAPKSAGPVTMWLVARDQRGGTAWTSIIFEVSE